MVIEHILGVCCGPVLALLDSDFVPPDDVGGGDLDGVLAGYTFHGVAQYPLVALRTYCARNVEVMTLRVLVGGIHLL